MREVTIVKLYMACELIILRIMSLLRPRTVVAFALMAAFASVPTLSAQITEIRELHGKQIACSRSGLRGFATPCGTDRGYKYVFAGSILSVIAIPNNEKRLVIAPEEVFLGDVPRELTVDTSQGECLPDVAPGDHWFFFIYQDQKKNLLLTYGSSSGPLADQQAELARLRRLKEMETAGIITGNVTQGIGDGTLEEFVHDIPQHKIIAKRKDDGVEFTALTDQEGNFEFEPLSPGFYHLTANTADGLWAEEGEVKVEAHGCSYVPFELHNDGSISGHVTTSTGLPAENAWVVIHNAASIEFHSTNTDSGGFFEVRGLRPGRYLVGIGIDAEPESKEWKNRVYYPSVKDKALAVVIELGKAEKHSNVDFHMLAQ